MITNPFESIDVRLGNIQELLQELKDRQGSEPQVKSPERKTLHSIRELADFLGCSTVTAQKFKNEGWLPFMQIGRKVMFDTAKVQEAIEKKGRRYKL